MQKDLGFDSKDSDSKKKNCHNCGNMSTMISRGVVVDGYEKYLCNNCYAVEYKEVDDNTHS